MESLCRICFEAGHFALKGYEVNVQNKTISIEQMIFRFSNIELVNANVPEMICETCTHDLVQCFLFMEKIEQADARILGLCSAQSLEENEALDGDEQDFEMEPNMGELVEEAKDSEYLDETEEGVMNSEEIDTEEAIEQQTEEEVYFDNEYVEEEEEENHDDNFIPSTDTVENDQNESQNIVLSEGLSDLITNFKEDDFEESIPKILCRKKAKLSKEVAQNGSFVVAQFTSSTASKMQMLNDENEEVTLSDVRTMNFETVEVKAGNLNGVKDDEQGELPVDDSRVYLCQYCPRAFSSSPYLIAHVRKSHGCKYCAQMFAKATDLFKHIREEHSTHRCVVCTKTFASNSNLRYHLKTIHKVKVPPNVSLLSYKKDSEDSQVQDEL